MPRQHVWTEREEDGVRREVRATWFGREWRLQSKRTDEEAWNYHQRPPFSDLVALLDVIERKYQRRRATIDELEAVRKLVKRHEEGAA